VQRVWRAFFFTRLLREEADFGLGEEDDFCSSLASMRLRRATRSEKRSQPAAQQNDEQTRLSLHMRRVEAAALLATFLRDMQKLFRNRILKYVR
jgi:hypothetical protein